MSRIATRTLALALASLLVAHDLPAQQAAAPASRTRAHVAALASDDLDGRLTGSAGEQRAGDYIVGELKRIGAQPLPGRTDYRLPFEFTAGTKDGGDIAVDDRRRRRPAPLRRRRTSVRALSFSDNAEVADLPVVFAGYGIVVPESQEFGYDSYATLDVKDKIVIVLRYFPEDADPKTKGILARYSDLRYKAMAARQRGASAVLVVTGPRSPNAGETIADDLRHGARRIGHRRREHQRRGRRSTAQLRAKKTLKATQESFDSGNPHVAGFEIPDLPRDDPGVGRAREAHRLQHRRLPAGDAAAVGRAEAVGGARRALRSPGPRRTWQLAGRKGRRGQGAPRRRRQRVGHGRRAGDRRAAGRSAAPPQRRPRSSGPARRSACIGSTAYVNAPVGSARSARGLPELRHGRTDAGQQADAAGHRHESGLGPVHRAGEHRGRVRPAAAARPVPADRLGELQPGERAHAQLLHRHPHRLPQALGHGRTRSTTTISIASSTFGAAIARRVVDAEPPPEFAKVEQQNEGGGRAGVRVFTGTIPDYSSEVKGLLLGGVIGGGPAEQAGLQKGDVIVEIAGQTIANIYDYTYALDVLKIGEPAKVVYVRSGERRETTLTPSARK